MRKNVFLFWRYPDNERHAYSSVKPIPALPSERVKKMLSIIIIIIIITIIVIT